MSDLSAIAAMATAGFTAYTGRLVHRTYLHSKLAKTPAEFVMMEKVAKPRKVKAFKTPPLPPYGL